MTVHLPVLGRGSQAASTAFCTARIDGPGGHLWLDGNGKITAANGTLKAPKPNAFSLPAGNTAARREHCPGSTPTCRASCYVHGLEAAVPDTFALYEHNAVEIRRILADEPHVGYWAMIVAEWITANAPGGFRWHVSGDIFSQAYAEWIALVVSLSPTVTHWIYTRSFGMIDPLVCLPNLALNLSCDADNYEHAREVARYESLVVRDATGKIIGGGWAHRKPALRLCYLSSNGEVPADLPPGSVIFPDYRLRGVGATPREMRNTSAWWASLTSEQRRMVCPVDYYGKAEGRRCGPCKKCLEPRPTEYAP